MLDIREEIMEELSGLAKLKDEELVRLKKLYAKLRKTGSERIQIPVLRPLLKIGDRWLKSKGKRIVKTILEVSKEKDKLSYALKEFKKGNKQPVKEVFIDIRAEKLALSSTFATYPDLAGGLVFPSVGSARYSRFLEFLESKE